MLITFDVNKLYVLDRLARELKTANGEWRKNIYHPTKFYPLKRILNYYATFIYDLVSYNIEWFDPLNDIVKFKAIYFSPDAYELIKKSIHPDFHEVYLPAYRLDLAFNECFLDEDMLLERRDADDT